MAKVTLSKIAPIKKVEPKTVTIAEQEIVVIQYLPTDDKIAFIERVLNATVDETGFFNPMRMEILFNIEIVRTYTNISITDKMMEEPTKLYDVLNLNGILDAVVKELPPTEYSTLLDVVEEAAKHIVAYNNSAVGIMKAITTNYQNTSMDVDGLMKTLNDPDKIGLVQDILQKLG